jgi:hypothetical protein
MEKRHTDHEHTGQSYAEPNALLINLKDAPSFLGIGGRYVVPANQIHVVSAGGRHVWFDIGMGTQVFGSSAEVVDIPAVVAPTLGEDGTPLLDEENNPITHVVTPATYKPAEALYWRNKLTKVIALTTVTFLVPVSGKGNMGIKLYDRNNTPFNVVAHVVASLDVKKAQLAAAKVGDTTASLVVTIEEVTQAQLMAAAATMELDAIIENRQQLASLARKEVIKTLGGLGFILELLTIEAITGTAFDLHVQEAEQKAVETTTTEINLSVTATDLSNQTKKQAIARQLATTTKANALEGLAAEQRVATLTNDKLEQVAASRQLLNLADQTRAEALDQATHDVAVKKITLEQAEALAKAEKTAAVDALTQEKAKTLELAAAAADDERAAEVQKRSLARAKEVTDEEAKRLERERLAQAERERKAALEEAESAAEVLTKETEAQAAADLLKAQKAAEAEKAKATAAEATAAATRMTDAAEGLAKADVLEREVGIALKKAEATRAQGLSEAAVDQKKAEAEIARVAGLRNVALDALEREAKLYNTEPALMELRKMEMQNAQDLAVVKEEQAARVAIMTALAPQIDLRIIGSNNNMGKLLANVMALGQGVQILAEEAPALGDLVSGARGAQAEGSSGFVDMLGRAEPAVRTLVKEIGPKVLSALSVEDLIGRLLPLIQGQTDIVTMLEGIRQDASFQVIGRFPAEAVLRMLGLTPGGEIADYAAAEAIPGNVEPTA